VTAGPVWEQPQRCSFLLHAVGAPRSRPPTVQVKLDILAMGDARRGIPPSARIRQELWRRARMGISSGRPRRPFESHKVYGLNFYPLKSSLPLCTQYGTLVSRRWVMVNFISIRELRPKLADVIARVHNQFDRYVITRRGKPEVMLISIEDYESILETLEIQSDKSLMRRLKQAEKDLKAGKGVPLDKIHKELGLV